MGFKIDHIGIERYPDVAVKYNISTTMAKKLSCKGLEDTHKIYLYNHNFIPEVSAKNMRLYLEKLKLLAKLIRRD